MSKLGRHLRIGFVGTLGALVSSMPLYAAAGAATPATFTNAGTQDIIITEFQTNGGSAAQEFIELYNTTDEDISLDGVTAAATDSSDDTADSTDIDDASSDAASVEPSAPQLWKLQFFNSASVKNGTPAWATATTTTNSIPLTGVIPAHEYFLVASTGYLPAGVLVSPSTGKSLQRVPNDDSEYINDDGSLMDFDVNDEPTPLDAWTAPVVAEDGDAEDRGTDDATTVAPAANEGLQAPQITELLPNPGSPLSDANDEFIELYNPNEAAFDLSGYKLEVGTGTLHTYTIPDGTVLAPLSYLAFYSGETGLSLSNSGGQARFRDPAGLVLNEAKAYGTAADNQAWILNDGTWEWTTTATPGQPNILAAPVAKKKAAAKKTTTSKAKTAKAKTTKAKTTRKKAAAKSTATVAAIDKPKPPIHVGVLVGVAAVAVLYGLYEYRHDIILKFQKLKRDRRTGSQNRLTAAGR